jgi:hypothetical protein
VEDERNPPNNQPRGSSSNGAPTGGKSPPIASPGRGGAPAVGHPRVPRYLPLAAAGGARVGTGRGLAGTRGVAGAKANSEMAFPFGTV